MNQLLVFCIAVGETAVLLSSSVIKRIIDFAKRLKMQA
jgi:hypothetical protein